jgi:hypothetical protein
MSELYSSLPPLFRPPRRQDGYPPDTFEKVAPQPAEVPTKHRTIPFTPCAACVELSSSAVDYVRIGRRLFAVPARRWTFAAFEGVPLCHAHARARQSEVRP